MFPVCERASLPREGTVESWGVLVLYLMLHASDFNVGQFQDFSWPWGSWKRILVTLARVALSPSS